MREHHVPLRAGVQGRRVQALQLLGAGFHRRQPQEHAQLVDDEIVGAVLQLLLRVVDAQQRTLGSAV